MGRRSKAVDQIGIIITEFLFDPKNVMVCLWFNILISFFYVFHLKQTTTLNHQNEDEVYYIK